MSAHSTNYDSSISTVIIGCSGHRALDDPSSVETLLDESLADILASQPEGTRFAAVSSVAAGADVLFCEAVRRRGIPLLVYLPFSEDEFREDFDGEFAEWWPRAKSLIDECRSRGALAHVEAQFSRNDGYLAAGQACVDQCTVLLAVAKAGPATSEVGAQAMVSYAQELKKPILLLDPDSAEAHWIGSDSSRSMHRVKARADFINECGSSVSSQFNYNESANLKWWENLVVSSSNFVSAGLRALTRGVHPLVGLIFGDGKRDKRSDLERGLPSSNSVDACLVPMTPGATARPAAQGLFDLLDRQALDMRLLRYGATLILLLEVIGTVVVASALIFSPAIGWLFPTLKVGVSGMTLLILVRLWIGHHASDLRLQAEAMRACLAQMTARCPIVSKPLNGQVSQSHASLDTFALGLRLADLWENDPANPIDDFRTSADRYCICRVDDQLAYFESNSNKAKPWLRLLNISYRVALFSVFIVSSSYLFYVLSSIGDTIRNGAVIAEQVDTKEVDANSDSKTKTKKVLFYLLPVTLAGIGTFCMATISVQELGRRFARYGDAARKLREQKLRLERAKTASNVIQIMRETEDYLAEEVYGWRNYSLFVNTH